MCPYGMIAPEIPFGSTRANYIKLASRIKTYTEQVANAELNTQLAAEIHRAACIVFLGFACHSQNIQLLRPSEPISTRHIFGTAYGMSDSDVDVVSQSLASFFKQTLDSRQRAQMIRLENKLKCAGLFDYYARSLSGGD